MCSIYAWWQSPFNVDRLSPARVDNMADQNNLTRVSSLLQQAVDIIQSNNQQQSGHASSRQQGEHSSNNQRQSGQFPPCNQAQTQTCESSSVTTRQPNSQPESQPTSRCMQNLKSFFNSRFCFLLLDTSCIYQPMFISWLIVYTQINAHAYTI